MIPKIEWDGGSRKLIRSIKVSDVVTYNGMRTKDAEIKKALRKAGFEIHLGHYPGTQKHFAAVVGKLAGKPSTQEMPT